MIFPFYMYRGNRRLTNWKTYESSTLRQVIQLEYAKNINAQHNICKVRIT